MFTSGSIMAIAAAVAAGLFGYWLKRTPAKPAPTPTPSPVPTPLPDGGVTPAPAPAPDGGFSPLTPLLALLPPAIRVVVELMFTNPEFQNAVKLLFERFMAKEQLVAHNMLWDLADPQPSVVTTPTAAPVSPPNPLPPK